MFVYENERGRVDFHIDPDQVHIDYVYVDPEHRGQGEAKGVIDVVTNLADRLNLPTWLETQSSGLIRIFERCGFELVEETETFFIMRRS